MTARHKGIVMLKSVSMPWTPLLKIIVLQHRVRHIWMVSELTNGSTEIDTGISICILYDVIIHPRPNFKGGWTKPPLKLGYGWVITTHHFMRVYFITSYFRCFGKLISVSTRSLCTSATLQKQHIQIIRNWHIMVAISWKISDLG